jgi:photosystem II stability/assembly factor-like uncharacterized protein
LVTLGRMFRLVALALVVSSAFVNALGQWQMQEAHTNANFRGIHAVDASVAWASGTEGTVLRTLDGGAHWQKCPSPAGAEKLDFRAVWAWNANEAMVMSAGPGEQSRVYKTIDGCAHWTEEFKNSDKDGFWDALVFQNLKVKNDKDERTGVLIGDPLSGRFDTKTTAPGKGWFVDDAPCTARAGESAFAASNSSVVVFGLGRYILGTGGKGGPRVLLSPLLAARERRQGCLEASVPLASGSESAGVFALGFRDLQHGVSVGGDYKKPDERSGTAAWTSDGGRHWTAATSSPHGYRSSVAWFPAAKMWIAAGTNGSDISRDDGKTWEPLDNGNWNALSVPYAVGPGGRIGKLTYGALKK